jgi:protein-arginine kinase activator protein McsA
MSWSPIRAPRRATMPEVEWNCVGNETSLTCPLCGTGGNSVGQLLEVGCYECHETVDEITLTADGTQ